MPSFKHKNALKVKICTFSQKMTTVDAKNISTITLVVRKPWSLNEIMLFYMH